MTNYKKLCAELIDAWDNLPWQYNWKGDCIGLDGYAPDEIIVERARAALAEPEPEGPTDEKLLELYQGPGTFSAIEYARAVLARWGNYPGSPDSSTPQPVLDPVAWMYQGEPSFDGTDWRETWEVTTDKRLAEFKATPDQPIPLFSIQLQPQ